MLRKQTTTRGKAIPAIPESNPVQAGPGREVQSAAPSAQLLEGVGPVAPTLDAQARNQWIAEAAYFRAREREFAAEHEMDDWFAAEAEFDRLLVGGGRPTA